MHFSTDFPPLATASECHSFSPSFQKEKHDLKWTPRSGAVAHWGLEELLYLFSFDFLLPIVPLNSDIDHILAEI